MQKRSVTVTILVAVAAFIGSAAYLLWSLQQQTSATIDAERRMASHADAIAETLSSIATAQQGYVAPGQLDEPLFEEATASLAHLAGQMNAFAPHLQSPEAAAHLEPLRQAVAALQEADARTRENLSRGQELMAADVIYSDGRNVVAAIATQLHEARAAEQTAARASLARAVRSVWTLFGLLVLASAAACAALVKHTRGATAPVTHAEIAPAPIQDTLAPSSSSPAHSVDQTALARLCTDVVRAADVRQLERALAAAARLLDASSVMLWMSAGDRLLPALAHGFPADALPRLKPIAGDADNAAAAAWQSGRVVQQVPATGDAGAAIVAPLFSPEAAIGVLAVELRPGRLPDADREAAVTVLAAQLSTVVSAWPAQSVPQPTARTA